MNIYRTFSIHFRGYFITKNLHYLVITDICSSSHSSQISSWSVLAAPEPPLSGRPPPPPGLYRGEEPLDSVTCPLATTGGGGGCPLAAAEPSETRLGFILRPQQLMLPHTGFAAPPPKGGCSGGAAEELDLLLNILKMPRCLGCLLRAAVSVTPGRLHWK
jgi:hypothetical protein